MNNFTDLDLPFWGNTACLFCLGGKKTKKVRRLDGLFLLQLVALYVLNC